jgi:hypothetical protein
MHAIKFVVPCLALAFGSAYASGERALREACGEFSQAGMRDCLVGKVDESRKVLKVAEAEASGRIAGWDEDPKYVNLAKVRLAASAKAFTAYRKEQCAFAAALGGGAIGNALEIRRLACEAELNHWRADQLQRALIDLPLK